MTPYIYKKTCCVCGSRSAAKGEKFHKFPQNVNVRKQWIKWCVASEVADINDNFTNAYICGKHFNKSCYRFSSKLRSSAVPTISTDIVDYATLNAPHLATDLENLHDVGMNRDATVSAPPPVTDMKNRHNIDVVAAQAAPGATSDEVHDMDIDVTVNDAPERSDHEVQHDIECFVSSPPIEKHFHEKTIGRFRFFGDFKSEDMEDSLKAKQLRRIAARDRARARKKLLTVQQSNRRLRKKITSLKSLLTHLKSKNLLSSEAVDQVLDCVPTIVGEVIARKLQGKSKKKDRKYSEEIRKFALTVQFYSDKAYKYLRSKFCKLLPHPRTISKWYYAVDGNAGFTKRSFLALKNNFKDKEKPFLCNLVMDEMKLKEELIWSGGKFNGQVDMGTELSGGHDNSQRASYALVFMAVGLNTQFKVPLGYFLIKGLNSEERANLTTKCIKLLHENGATVTSVTFDGAKSNLVMAGILGAELDPLSEDFKPTFPHPITNNKIFIFLDACHMLKLLRNSLGDLKTLVSPDNEVIRWEHIVELHKLQDREGLRAANKLTEKHIYYYNNKMSVKLAAQVLSHSTSDSLTYLEHCQNLETFKYCGATAEYCLNVNNCFDILNCKSKFSKQEYSKPINEDTKEDLREKAKVLILYFKNLKDGNGTTFLKSSRKTGALGFIVALTNIFELYEQYKNKGLQFLLTFKLSQDFIETFFSAVRSRGGWNLYPNASQFKTAYKRLLVKNQLNLLAHGNCEADGFEILTTSSSYTQSQEDDLLYIMSRQPQHCDPIGLDDNESDEGFCLNLSIFVEDVSKYIAGFVVGKLKHRNLVTCEICLSSLMEAKGNLLLHVSELSLLKDRGPYVYPSKEVVKLCLETEKVLRTCESHYFANKNLKQLLHMKVFRSVGIPFDTSEMNNHILTQNFLDNHKMQLTKMVIDYYLKVRLHHYARNQSKKENMKQKHKDLAKFSSK